MAKDIVDRKARTGIPGVAGLGRVTNASAWGEQKALERTKDYGGLKQQVDMRPKDQSIPQRLGDANNLIGSDYYDDEPADSWLRGGGKGGEGYPNFQPGYKGKK